MTGLKLIGLAAAFGLCAATAQAQSAGDWAHFGGPLGDTKYSALDQINSCILYTSYGADEPTRCLHECLCCDYTST